MEIVSANGLIPVSWFLVLLAFTLVIAVVSKSLLANIALIAVAVLGIDFGWRLSGVGFGMNVAVVGFMLCLIGFAIFQMLGAVEDF